MVFCTSWPHYGPNFYVRLIIAKALAGTWHSVGHSIYNLCFSLTLFPGVWGDSEATRLSNPWNEVPHVKWNGFFSAGCRSSSKGKIHLPWCLCAALVSKLYILYPSNITNSWMMVMRLFELCLNRQLIICYFEWPPMRTTSTFSWLLQWRTTHYTSKDLGLRTILVELQVNAGECKCACSMCRAQNDFWFDTGWQHLVK